MKNAAALSLKYRQLCPAGEVAKSAVFVPLIARGEAIGVISLQNLDQEHAFSDSDVSLITTLANSMSVALESAALFHQTSRLLQGNRTKKCRTGRHQQRAGKPCRQNGYPGHL